MGTTRTFPQSIIGRKKALNKAVAKNNSLPVGTVILSPADADRLNIDNTNYNLGVAAVISTNQLYHAAVELARPQRIALKASVNGYYTSLNNCIKLGTIPASARAFYGLPVNKAKMPSLNTDDKLLTQAAIVISGDLARKTGGGIAMSNPTIAQFTTVNNTANPVIFAINTAFSNYTTATTNLEEQTSEVKDIITHVWDDVEAYYSRIAAAARRTQGRLWGIGYRSTGIFSVVTGSCKSNLGVPMAGVKVRILGSSTSILSDVFGKFSLNTSLYGDLEIEATHLNYEKNITDFTKEDGVAMVVDLVMNHI